ncbi:hypothetical protein D3C73_1284520 [compost metagenome]
MVQQFFRYFEFPFDLDLAVYDLGGCGNDNVFQSSANSKLFIVDCRSLFTQEDCMLKMIRHRRIKCGHIFSISLKT